MATVSAKSRNPWRDAGSSEPGEGALDHPAARQDDEAPHVVAPLNDLHAQPYFGIEVDDALAMAEQVDV